MSLTQIIVPAISALVVLFLSQFINTDIKFATTAKEAHRAIWRRLFKIVAVVLWLYLVVAIITDIPHLVHDPFSKTWVFIFVSDMIEAGIVLAAPFMVWFHWMDRHTFKIQMDMFERVRNLIVDLEENADEIRQHINLPLRPPLPPPKRDDDI